MCCMLTDVYSYAEDDMVVDPLLADHLAHFGIDIMSMQKVCEVHRYSLRDTVLMHAVVFTRLDLCFKKASLLHRLNELHCCG